MVTFKKNVERWRSDVNRELERQGIPLPTDLILSLIRVESRGTPGLVNPKSGASGLMQVMPKTLEWYNQQNPNVALSTLRSESGGAAQIRVGLWVLGQYWKSAYRYLRDKKLSPIPTERLAELADLFYVAGPGATKRRGDKLRVPFLNHFETRYPNWNALPHPRNVFRNIPGIDYDLSSISKWLEGSVYKQRNVAMSVVVMLGAVLVVYWFFMKESKNGKEKKQVN